MGLSDLRHHMFSSSRYNPFHIINNIHDFFYISSFYMLLALIRLSLYASYVIICIKLIFNLYHLFDKKLSIFKFLEFSKFTKFIKLF